MNRDDDEEANKVTGILMAMILDRGAPSMLPALQCSFLLGAVQVLPRDGSISSLEPGSKPTAAQSGISGTIKAPSHQCK